MALWSLFPKRVEHRDLLFLFSPWALLALCEQNVFEERLNACYFLTSFQGSTHHKRQRESRRFCHRCLSTETTCQKPAARPRLTVSADEPPTDSPRSQQGLRAASPPH